MVAPYGYIRYQHRIKYFHLDALLINQFAWAMNFIRIADYNIIL